MQGQQDLAVEWRLFSVPAINNLDRPELLAPPRVRALARRGGDNRAVAQLYQAMNDPATLEEIMADHRAAVD